MLMVCFSVTLILFELIILFSKHEQISCKFFFSFRRTKCFGTFFTTPTRLFILILFQNF